ncbi:hypothetical protein ABIF70_008495 [Bradyrhizobium japonicum]
MFAKLDRLTRNVDLLRSLVASDVDLVFCDLPSVPPGPMGKFLLTQMAAVVELEAGLIGERTKKALAAAKARGVKLGNSNGARALRGKQTGNAEAVAKIKDKAAQLAMGLQGILDGIKRSGITSVRAITEELTVKASARPVATHGTRLLWCGYLRDWATEQDGRTTNVATHGHTAGHARHRLRRVRTHRNRSGRRRRRSLAPRALHLSDGSQAATEI